MRLVYCREARWADRHGDDGTTSIECFYRRARAYWTGMSHAAGLLVLELQPGDGTRYRCSLAMDERHRTFVFAAWIPEVAAFEYEPRGPAPDVFDHPFCALNPWTAAIYADVVRAVAWGLDWDRYDYVAGRPSVRA